MADSGVDCRAAVRHRWPKTLLFFLATKGDSMQRLLTLLFVLTIVVLPAHTHQPGWKDIPGGHRKCYPDGSCAVICNIGYQHVNGKCLPKPVVVR